MAGGLLEYQYGTADPLQVRQMTHVKYSEQPDNIHKESLRLLDLSGREAIIDIGCGPGGFLHSLRAAGHHGRLVGLDNSSGETQMIIARSGFPRLGTDNDLRIGKHI